MSVSLNQRPQPQQVASVTSALVFPEVLQLFSNKFIDAFCLSLVFCNPIPNKYL